MKKARAAAKTRAKVKNAGSTRARNEGTRQHDRIGWNRDGREIQYSSPSMIVITRLVMAGSDESGE